MHPSWQGHEALGQQIRALRRMRGVTQRALAQRVGLSRTSVTNIELGRQPVTVEMFYRITAALGFACHVKLVPVQDDPVRTLWADVQDAVAHANGGGI
jgi:transcriptional regulator with XRE-family HTH domain